MNMEEGICRCRYPGWGELGLDWSCGAGWSKVDVRLTYGWRTVDVGLTYG